MPRHASSSQQSRGNSSRKTNPSHATRWKKGTSGNPSGRPKGSRNLSSYILEAARDEVTVTVAGKARKVTKLQASVMQLATKAAGGDQTAINKFLDWIDEVETRANAVKSDQYPFSPADLEVLHAIYDRMKQSKPNNDGEQNGSLSGRKI